MAGDGEVLSLESVSKAFRTRRGFLDPPRVVSAVRRVSLRVRRGESFGLVGESGSGKTTLARLMVGLLQPSAGRVSFGGGDLSALRPSEMRLLRRELQIVFQDPVSALDPRQTAFQALREVLRVHGLLGGRDGLSEVRKLLGMVDLRWEDAHRLPHELSGGQCQRLAIARALAPSPTVLVADEPVSQLDVSTQAQILSLVDELRSRLGLTVVLIAHDLSVVRRVAERVAVMHAGMIVEEAPTEGIFERPLHPFTRLLLRSVPRSGARRQNAVNSRSRTSWPASGERCPFAERCQDRRAECTDTLPELRTVEDGRRAVRCLFA